MRQRLLLLLFIVCALCLIGSALVVSEADTPARPPLPPSAPVFRVFSALPPPDDHGAPAAQPIFSGESQPVKYAVQPVVPSADSNGTPLAAGRYFRAAYVAFHYSDKAG